MLHDPQSLATAVAGKTVLVTGASSGIGEALCVRLGRAGANVLAAARRTEQLQSLCREITDEGGQAHDFTLDLRDFEQVDRVVGEILERHGAPDVVVHNAGKSIRRPLWQSLERPHDFERTMAINYMGPVRLQLALSEAMRRVGGGHLVNVSSLSVRLPAPPHWAAYHCSKLAFDQWLAAAVPELRPHGIAVTSIYFGLVHTPMSAPTPAYAKLPGLTADQAAMVVARALVRRPRHLQPWWLGPARLLTLPFEAPLERVQAAILKRVMRS